MSHKPNRKRMYGMLVRAIPLIVHRHGHHNGVEDHHAVMNVMEALLCTRPEAIKLLGKAIAKYPGLNIINTNCLPVPLGARRSEKK